MKQALGGRVRILLSGAAPLPPHVEEFLRVTFGSTLAQGYGILLNLLLKKCWQIVLGHCELVMMTLYRIL